MSTASSPGAALVACTPSALSMAALRRSERGRPRRVATSVAASTMWHAALLAFVATTGVVPLAAVPQPLHIDLASLSFGVGAAPASAPGGGAGPASLDERRAEAPRAAQEQEPVPQAATPPDEKAADVPEAVVAAPRVTPPPRSVDTKAAGRTTNSRESVRRSDAPAPPRSEALASSESAGAGAPGSGSPAGRPGGGGGHPAGKTGGGSSVEASYRARLVAWLARYKRYPARARAMGLEGVVLARIVVDRNGSVRSSEARSESGPGLFVDEVESMIERSAPFPPAPAELDGDTLQVTVPIEFRLTKEVARD